MKKELNIPASYVEELWNTYESEVDNKEELTFPEYLYGEYATDPTMYSSLELGGFCPDNENVEEFSSMSEEDQKKEIEVRFMFFVKKSEEILKREFAKQSFEEIKTKVQKMLGY